MTSDREQKVDALLDRLRGYSLREAGERVGVSHDTIRRIRSGEWETLQAQTWRKIEAFLDRSGLQGGGPADYVMAGVRGYFRQLEGPAGAERKRDALDALRRFFSAVGELPDEWYALRSAIETQSVGTVPPEASELVEDPRGAPESTER